MFEVFESIIANVFHLSEFISIYFSKFELVYKLAALNGGFTQSVKLMDL